MAPLLLALQRTHAYGPLADLAAGWAGLFSGWEDSAAAGADMRAWLL
jgi:hypothetical protein